MRHYLSTTFNKINIISFANDVHTPEGGEQTVIREKTAEPFWRVLEGACTVQSLNLLSGFMIDFK